MEKGQQAMKFKQGQADIAASASNAATARMRQKCQDEREILRYQSFLIGYLIMELTCYKEADEFAKMFNQMLGMSDAAVEERRGDDE